MDMKTKKIYLDDYLDIKYPKRVVRDLLSYKRLVDMALDQGKGNYKYLSAECLHDMKIFYLLTRFAYNGYQIRNLMKYAISNKRSSDFIIPSSLDNFFLKYEK